MAPGGAGNSGLRSRKVDLKKALPVYRYTEVIDLDETSAINRAIPQVATGVEKEEEEEHHLQAALVASQAGVVSSTVYIPTPDAKKTVPDYDQFYTQSFQQPKSLIRFSTQIEDVIGCPYNIDEKDDEFLADIASRIRTGKLPADAAYDEDKFESLMWAFERAGNDKVSGEAPSLEECKQFFEREGLNQNLSNPALPLVYEHWKKRRYVVRGGLQIQPQLRTEEVGLRPDNDPYICFRRREVKQLRKARRGDSQSLEKLRRLRDEMNRAKEILEMVTKREASRKESVTLEHLIFEQRVLVRRLKKKLGVVAPDHDSPEQKAKKKLKGIEGGRPLSTIRIPVNKILQSQHTFSDVDTFAELSPISETATVEDKVRRRKMLEEHNGWVDATEDPYILLKNLNSQILRLYKSNLPISLVEAPATPLDRPSRTFRVPHGRRRIGRGGRIVFDRHVRPRHWIPRRNGGKHLPGQSPAQEQGDLWEDEDWTEEEWDMWAQVAQQWRYDHSDDEVEEEEIVEVEDTVSSMAYRACTLGPNEQEYRIIINRPAHPEQIHVTPTTAAQRAQMQPTPPPQVIRSPSMSLGLNGMGMPKKRLSRPTPDGTPSKPPNPNAQKRKQEAMDPRQAMIKSMMAQAAQNAQRTQQQFAQGQSQMMPPNHVTANGLGMGGMQSPAPLVGSPPPMTPNGGMPNGMMQGGPVSGANSSHPSPSLPKQVLAGGMSRVPLNGQVLGAQLTPNGNGMSQSQQQLLKQRMQLANHQQQIQQLRQHQQQQQQQQQQQPQQSQQTSQPQTLPQQSPSLHQQQHHSLPQGQSQPSNGNNVAGMLQSNGMNMQQQLFYTLQQQHQQQAIAANAYNIQQQAAAAMQNRARLNMANVNGNTAAAMALMGGQTGMNQTNAAQMHALQQQFQQSQQQQQQVAHQQQQQQPASQQQPQQHNAQNQQPQQSQTPGSPSPNPIPPQSMIAIQQQMMMQKLKQNGMAGLGQLPFAAAMGALQQQQQQAQQQQQQQQPQQPSQQQQQPQSNGGGGEASTPAPGTPRMVAGSSSS
ncbi:Enhancer of polycomb-like protein 1, partial [Borealophlyctis nickersoniae]